MKRAVFVLAITTLAGCSALGIGPKSEHREATTVSCSGSATWENCNDKAKEMCPKGYDVTKREENIIAQKRVLHFNCN